MSRWMAGREEAVKQFAKATPLGRVCRPEDVADVIVPLLLSAAMVTGQTVLIDGGSRDAVARVTGATGVGGVRAGQGSRAVSRNNRTEGG